MTKRNWQPQELVIESDLGEIRVTGYAAGAFETALEGFEDVSLTAIGNALRGKYHVEDEPRSAGYLKERSLYLESVVASIVMDPAEELEPYDELWFDLLCDGSLCATFDVYRPFVQEDELASSIVEVLAARLGCEVIRVEFVNENLGRDSPFWSITLRPSTRDLTVADIASTKGAATHILRLPVGADKLKMPRLEWEVARDILLAGHPAYLLGQTESAWLEVKSQDFEAGPAGEIELCQDITRFANGDEPGLLALGYREKFRGGKKIIDKMTPLPLEPNAPSRYHKIIDRLVYPTIRGLRVESVAVNGRVVIVFVVPKQDEEDKPFLVTGAMVDGKCEGAFISIVRRRGEHSIPITPATIHAALAAGRRALRTTWSTE